MRASEAIAILESLDPSHEVTLTISEVSNFPKQGPVPITSVYSNNTYTPEWVIRKGFWPSQIPKYNPNEVTCKMH